MDDLVEIRYIGSDEWITVSRFLATGMTGIDIREIENKGILEMISSTGVNVKEKTCTWKKGDYGSFGIPSYEYKTSCGENYDCDNMTKLNYCPNCGGKLL
jgi:hypothetical protein